MEANISRWKGGDAGMFVDLEKISVNFVIAKNGMDMVY
jgi:hypothetical protein